MGDNRTRTFTEREESSYTPLRADHDHDHDHDEAQDGDDENDGEEYEMIKRSPGHESES